jgi:C1A family cysteine protease
MSLKRIKSYLLNHKRDTPDKRDHPFVCFLSSSVKLPSNVDLSPEMPPVWDQRSYGSCTAQGSGAALVYILHKLNSPNKFKSKPSRFFIYTNGRLVGGLPIEEDTGCQVRDVLKGIATYFCPDEKEWKYTKKNAFVKPPAEVYAAAKKYHTTQYLSVKQNLTAMKRCLAAGFPIVIGIDCYDSLMTQEVMDAGVIPMPDVKKESLQGGHCLLLVGYDDKSKRFLLRNSWGTDVGLPTNRGYFEIPYDYLTNPNLASDFWTVRLYA